VNRFTTWKKLVLAVLLVVLVFDARLLGREMVSPGERFVEEASKRGAKLMGVLGREGGREGEGGVGEAGRENERAPRVPLAIFERFGRARGTRVGG